MSCCLKRQLFWNCVHNLTRELGQYKKCDCRYNFADIVLTQYPTCSQQCYEEGFLRMTFAALTAIALFFVGGIQVWSVQLVKFFLIVTDNFRRDEVNIQVWDKLAFSFGWVRVREKMCV